MNKTKPNARIAVSMSIFITLLGLAFAPKAAFPGAERGKALPTIRPNLRIMKVAHRGAKRLAPENTLPAIEKAIELRYDYAEMDLTYSRDGVPIIIHDPTLSRTTNGFGVVPLTSFKKIRRLDAGAWFGPQFKGVKIPRFEECLQLMRGKIKLYLDQKGPPPPELLPLLKKYDFYPRDIVVVGLKNFQVKFLKYDPNAPVMPKLKKADEVDSILARFPSAIAFNTSGKSLTPEMVERAHRRGVMVFANVLRADSSSEERRRMERVIESGADAIQFDNLDMFDSVLEEIKSR